MIRALLYGWVALCILAMLWVVLFALSDWAYDINLTMKRAIRHRCVALWGMVKRFCEKLP